MYHVYGGRGMRLSTRLIVQHSHWKMLSHSPEERNTIDSECVCVKYYVSAMSVDHHGELINASAG